MSEQNFSREAKQIINRLEGEPENPRFSAEALKQVAQVIARTADKHQLGLELLVATMRFYQRRCFDAAAQLAAIATHIIDSEKAGEQAQRVMQKSKATSPTRRALKDALSPEATKKKPIRR